MRIVTRVNDAAVALCRSDSQIQPPFEKRRVELVLRKLVNNAGTCDAAADHSHIVYLIFHLKPHLISMPPEASTVAPVI